MMIQTIENIDFQNKRAIVRCDFNVPLKDGIIQDDTRIREAIPTIKLLLDKGASIILMSHLGRPKGKRVEEMSLRPVADRLSQLLERDIRFSTETVGEEPLSIAGSMQPGEILLLENLRFYPGEKDNDPGFADALAGLADVFVQDAFGTAHRKHASIVGVAGRLPSVSGKLLQKEIEFLSKGLNPEKPLVVCLGGAKLETKIPIIENMLEKADTILIGGGMAYTLLKAKGIQIGKSLVDEGNIQTAENILKKAENLSTDLLLPVDHVVTDNIEVPGKIEKTENQDIPEDMIGVDIGSKTQSLYKERVMDAKTIVLNGPMGVFELNEFSQGTRELLNAVTDSTSKGASSIAGGGDTVSAIKKLGFEGERFTHISTGGGASLKFLEGNELPGIQILDK